jgi:amino acid transporter
MYCAISICCAASRATWAFSRDQAIPGHRIFSRVNASLGDVPLYAFLLSTMIQVLLGLIYLGSSAAFNAFSSVGVICLGTSYALPVGQRKLKPGWRHCCMIGIQSCIEHRNGRQV